MAITVQTIEIDELPDSAVEQLAERLRTDQRLRSALVDLVRRDLHAHPVQPRLMTQAEVREALKIGATKLHKLRTGQVGDVPFPRPCYVGSSPRWRVEDIEQYIEEATRK
ncbi:MAG: hypothetical protein AAGE94_14570 [Acidobacteriota bacterium]